MIKKLLELGLHKGLSQKEERLIRLLNIICLGLLGAYLLMFGPNYIFEKKEKYYYLFISHSVPFLSVLLTQYFQSQRKYKTARIVFISSFLIVFTLSRCLFPEYSTEILNIISPLLALLFLSDKRIQYLYLILAIVSVFVPKYLHIETQVQFEDPTFIPFLFVILFFAIRYAINITRKNEELLNAQKKELERMYSFQNQFFVNVAHEIRTPITIIKGNSKRVENSNINIEIKKSMRSVIKQSDKIHKIVNDVLNLAT